MIDKVKNEFKDLPIILQSRNEEAKNFARINNISFLDKNSKTMLIELSDIMRLNFGFGDFVFKLPNGTKLANASNLRELRDKMRVIEDDSLLYHCNHNHFSYWLIARTHFELANKIKPVNINHFDSVIELRTYLVNEINKQISLDTHGVISVFDRNETEKDVMFQVIGEGSLGGKARGLGFIDRVLKNYISSDLFKNITISIPKTVVVATEVFNQFMERNQLYKIALNHDNDEYLLDEFLKADVPPSVLGDLSEFLNKAKYPIAVRSSSLLEDAMYRPFAGVYATVMIPNSSLDKNVRFHNLTQAIKLVFASTFFKEAKNYIEATGNRIEEEKMAVILQEMVGKKFEDKYYYPNISGVARSYNYYPYEPAT